MIKGLDVSNRDIETEKIEQRNTKYQVKNNTYIEICACVIKNCHYISITCSYIVTPVNTNYKNFRISHN